jgi:capsular polysaccharide biosynthesis protein
VPALPSNPVWLWTLLVGSLLATLVGLGSAFAADYFDPTVRTPDELEQILKIPVLSAMPKTSG